jgi:hypothetical protein
VLLVTSPDTTEAIREAIRLAGRALRETKICVLTNHRDAAFERIEEGIVAIADAVLRFQDLEDNGYAIVKVDEVPPWMAPWGFIRYGGGFVFGGSGADESRGEVQLYRLNEQ